MLAVLSLSPETIDTLFSLAFGFAVAGLCASGYCLFSRHFPSFRLLEMGRCRRGSRRFRCSFFPRPLSSCAIRSASVASKGSAPRS